MSHTLSSLDAFTPASCALPVPFMMPLNMLEGTLLVLTLLMLTSTLMVCANTIATSAVRIIIRMLNS